jgi:hypothetical protein
MKTQYHHHTAIASNIIESWYSLAVAWVRMNPTNKTNKPKPRKQRHPIALP